MLNIKINWEPAPCFCARKGVDVFTLPALSKTCVLMAPVTETNSLWPMNPGATVHKAQNSKVCTLAAEHTGQLQSQVQTWPCSTALHVQQQLGFRYAQRRKKKCLPWNSVLTSHFISNNFSTFSCKTEKYSGVSFIGFRWYTEVKKTVNQQKDDNTLGRKRKASDILQSDAEVWKVGRATCGQLIASQDAAGNLTTSFLPDRKVKEDEVMWKVGLGSCFSIK